MKFRASMCGNLMKNDRTGKKMGETAKKELRRIWIGETYGRWKSIENKQIKKGNKQEEEAITLLSMFDKKMYFKNSIRLENEYLSGEPDLSDSNDITKANETLDTKCSWDIFTFYDAVDSEISDVYYWQGQVYMELTGAKKHSVCHCLVNTPDDLIVHELYKDSFNWEDNNPPLWSKLQIVSNCIYDKSNFQRFCANNDLIPSEDDIQALAVYRSFVEVPLSKRVHKKSFEADPEQITALYTRLDQCREHIKTFEP